MSVVQGGSGLLVLNSSVYGYLSGMELSNIIAQVSDIPDTEVREVLKKYVTCQLCHCKVHSIANLRTCLLPSANKCH